MQNGLNDVDSCKDMPYAVKIATVSNLTPNPKQKIWFISIGTLLNLLNFAFNSSGLSSKHPFFHWSTIKVAPGKGK